MSEPETKKDEQDVEGHMTSRVSLEKESSGEETTVPGRDDDDTEGHVFKL